MPLGPHPRGRHWPQADALFHRDPLWRGADAAYSVALGGGRTMWLFGDTFVGPSRRTAAFVHNSVALQADDDPTTAALEIRYGGRSGEPQPFFGAESGWLWPMAGALTPAGVLVFLMRVRSARPDLPTPLDAWKAEGSLQFFEVHDWTAALVRGVDGPPDSWRAEMLPTPPSVDRIIPGAGVIAHGDHLYAYGWRDGHALRPGRIRRRPRYRGFRRPRLAFLLRWPLQTIDRGLGAPEWWAGSQWATDPSSATAVLEDPATEFTVHREASSGRFVLTEAIPWLRLVDGVPALAGLRVLKRHPSSSRLLARLGVLRVSVSRRYATHLQGPWSRPERLLTPRVASDVIVYAGKAHPQLRGPGLVCTYATIARTADRALDDESLYYPRFVVLS
ncbi:MAG: hypothetical protein ACYDAC_05620 [Candidatus Dormibacteria bacterium]